MVSYIVLLPILEALVTILVTALEVPKGILSVKIAKLNEELSNIGEPEHQTFAIGFQAPNDDDYYEEEEDD